MVPSAPHSAPANIVFQNIQSPYPVSHADPDFDEMSPLTSPWLGAYNTNQGPSDGPGPPRNMQSQHPGSGSAGIKRRTVSPGSDGADASGRPSRKRQAPGTSRLSVSQNPVPPSIPSMSRTRRSSLRGGTKSASSTPLFPPIGSAGSMTPTLPSTRGSRNGPNRGNMIPNDIPGDTPSPVDLSMPPPATPQPQAPMNFIQDLGSTDQSSALTSMPAQGLIQPVTPASIMNLGRLGTDSSLAPLSAEASGQQANASRTKAKATGRPRSATITGGTKNAGGALISPALKPLRPGMSRRYERPHDGCLLLISQQVQRPPLDRYRQPPVQVLNPH